MPESDRRLALNYRQLETFRAVMLSGSASRAAELLDITQPAVSRTIAELEKGVGFVLFERIKGRLVTTPEAQMLLNEVEKSFVGLDRIRAEAARIRDFGAGSLRIASLAALGSTLVPRDLQVPPKAARDCRQPSDSCLVGGQRTRKYRRF